MKDALTVEVDGKPVMVKTTGSMKLTDFERDYFTKYVHRHIERERESFVAKHDVGKCADCAKRSKKQGESWTKEKQQQHAASLFWKKASKGQFFKANARKED